MNVDVQLRNAQTEAVGSDAADSPVVWAELARALSPDEMRAIAGGPIVQNNTP